MKELMISVPEYNPEIGFKFNWEKGFVIQANIEHDNIIISANKEGLLSLANHLLNLAQDKVPSGYHLHLDEFNSLEKGSKELIIQKD